MQVIMIWSGTTCQVSSGVANVLVNAPSMLFLANSVKSTYKSGKYNLCFKLYSMPRLYRCVHGKSIQSLSVRLSNSSTSSCFMIPAHTFMTRAVFIMPSRACRILWTPCCYETPSVTRIYGNLNMFDAVFFIRDGISFPDMVHALKPNPRSHIQEW